MRSLRALPLVLGIATVGAGLFALSATSPAAPSAPAPAAPSASASPAPSSVSSSTPEDRAAARALFLEGMKLYDASDYAKALEKFERAWNLVPVAAVRFNVGRCLAQLGRLVEAVRELEATEAQAKAESKDAVAKSAAEAADALRPRIPTLTLSISPAFATAKLDGVSLPASAWKSIAVDPGTHTIEASAPKYATTTKTVVLAEKAKTLVAIKLDAK